MVDARRLSDQLAHAHAGVEGGERVLEDHLPVEARGRAGAAFVQDLSARGLHEPCDHAAERGLPAAGFAHDAQHLAAREREAHAIDGADGAGARGEAHGGERAGEDARLPAEDLGEVLRFQKRRGHAASDRRREWMQAATRPGATSMVGGGTAQAAVARGQRGAKAQPGGSSVSDGIRPGICGSRTPFGCEAGTLSMRPRV